MLEDVWGHRGIGELRDNTLKNGNPEIDADALRKLLHDVSNSVHSIGLSTELARLHLDRNNAESAATALDSALDERENCNELLSRIRALLANM